MINHEVLYTIQALDYEKAETALKLAKDVKKEDYDLIRKIIADHRALIKIREQLIKQQTIMANGIFSLESVQDNETLVNTQQSDNDVASNDDEENPEDKKQTPNHKKTGKKALPPGETFQYQLTEDEKTCPSCGDTMHMQRAKTTSVVISVPLFKTETHIAESCRCLKCETQSTAVIPKHATEEEMIGRYHFSAVANLIALRYQYGMASYRVEQFSENVGLKISDSTQWFLFEEAATQVRQFFLFLKKFASNAPVKHVDDTNNLVLSLAKGIEQEQEKARFNGLNPNNIRTGIHTTNMTAVFPEGQIVIYDTGSCPT